MDFDWAAVSSQFTAVCVAAYGLYKAVVKFVSAFKKKRSTVNRASARARVTPPRAFGKSGFE